MNYQVKNIAGAAALAVILALGTTAAHAQSSDQKLKESFCPAWSDIVTSMTQDRDRGMPADQQRRIILNQKLPEDIKQNMRNVLDLIYANPGSTPADFGAAAYSYCIKH